MLLKVDCCISFCCQKLRQHSASLQGMVRHITGNVFTMLKIPEYLHSAHVMVTVIVGNPHSV